MFKMVYGRLYHWLVGKVGFVPHLGVPIVVGIVMSNVRRGFRDAHRWLSHPVVYTLDPRYQLCREKIRELPLEFFAHDIPKGLSVFNVFPDPQVVENGRIVLFRMHFEATHEEVMNGYAVRGLVPCPFAQLQWYKQNSDFSERTNITIWKNGGLWYSLSLQTISGKTTIWIARMGKDYKFGCHLWFAGVRKQ